MRYFNNLLSSLNDLSIPIVAFGLWLAVVVAFGVWAHKAKRTDSVYFAGVTLMLVPITPFMLFHRAPGWAQLLSIVVVFGLLVAGMISPIEKRYGRWFIAALVAVVFLKPLLAVMTFWFIGLLVFGYLAFLLFRRIKRVRQQKRLRQREIERRRRERRASRQAQTA